MRRVTIKRNFTGNSYRRRFFTVKCHNRHINTTVTSTPAVVRWWLHKVRFVFSHHFHTGRLVVGLGVQWRENDSEPATLQLCVGRFCLVFQLLYARRVPLCLRRFLLNPSITFVGVWNNRDGEMLSRSRHDLSVNQLIDARHVAAERRGCNLQISMERLADEILGIDGVDKPSEIARSNWNVTILSHSQVTYACVDAFLSFCLGRDLEAWDWNNRNTYQRGFVSCLIATGRETEYSSDDQPSLMDDDEIAALKNEDHQYHYDEDCGSYFI